MALSGSPRKLIVTVSHGLFLPNRGDGYASRRVIPLGDAVVHVAIKLLVPLVTRELVAPLLRRGHPAIPRHSQTPIAVARQWMRTPNNVAEFAISIAGLASYCSADIINTGRSG